MNIFYVDSENVEESWVELLKKVEPDTRIYVFYTENSKNIRISDIHLLRDFRGALETIAVEKGNNALDFQLASMLGYHIAKAEATHIILSGDKGFIPLEEFWKDKAKVIVLENEIAYAQYQETGKVPERHRKSSGKIVSETLQDQKERRRVQSILDKCNGYELSQIYERLTGEFGEARGLEIYRRIKAHLRD